MYSWRSTGAQTNPHIPTVPWEKDSLSSSSNTLDVNQASSLAAMALSTCSSSRSSSNKFKSRRRRSRNERPSSTGGNGQGSDNMTAQQEENGSSPVILKVCIPSCVSVRAVMELSFLQNYRISMVSAEPRDVSLPPSRPTSPSLATEPARSPESISLPPSSSKQMTTNFAMSLQVIPLTKKRGWGRGRCRIKPYKQVGFIFLPILTS